jgi:hypothetical protein
MNNLTRRDVFKLTTAGAVAAMRPTAVAAPRVEPQKVGVWEIFEIALEAVSTGNPFVEVRISATFTLGHRSVEASGFYDGEANGKGAYKVRFMPDTAGRWTYTTSSNLPALDGHSGIMEALPPLSAAHGPVRVSNTHHFAYADGTPFYPFGTTCYAWMHQPEALQNATLETLRHSPFNKVRMCIFPKSYEYNHNEPELYPFVRSAAGVNDYTRPNPAFFAHIERRIDDLRAAGIEADLILFHPYDRWGYAAMPAEADDFYLRYAVARLAAYRNVWWSLANEFDLMKSKSAQDFDRLFHIVEEEDNYAHLRSIHYSVAMYDYSRPWVTHASLQSTDFAAAPGYLAAWKKPVCYDEVMYEGNLNRRWGNLSGDEMTRRFWLGVIAGCYVTHGETYMAPEKIFDETASQAIFWSHGGPLRGSSPQQIGFLRKILEESCASGKEQPERSRTGLTADLKPYYLNATAYKADGKTADAILYYFDFHQPLWYEFPLPEGDFTAEWIDPLAMTITLQPGHFSGKAKLRLPGKPYQAVRFRSRT